MPPDEDAHPSPDDARELGAAERSQRLADLAALAGGAAHDVNNVLGVILGYVELARMGLESDPAKAAGWLEKALSSVDRAREVSDGLLDAVRREGLAPDLAPLAEAVDAGATLLAHTLGPAVVVEVTGAEAEGPCTPLDLPRLRQVVVALGLDAAAAMPDGGRLTLAVGHETAGAGTRAWLRVSDTGHAPRPTPEGARSVAVARAIVERWGGTLTTVAGAEGGEARVELPCALAVPPRRAAPAEGARVLVVDADAATREILRERLSGRAFTVHEAGTLAEARALLAGQACDLLLVDAVLPDGTGAELAAEAEVAGLVFTTGRPDTLPLLPPHARVLPKPYLEADLAEALREALADTPG